MSSKLGKSGKLGAGKSRTGSGVLYYMAVAQWQKNVHDLWLAQWWGYTHTHTQSLAISMQMCGLYINSRGSRDENPSIRGRQRFVCVLS